MKCVVLFLSIAAATYAVTPIDRILAPPGFKVEMLKEAGERDGSWISMALDGEGRIYISPQGSIPETGFAKDSKWGGLVRATVGAQGVEKWERVPVPVGDAMGMLWAFDSLYVSGQGPEGRGIYRCKDTNGDSIPDQAKLWKAVPGGAGEHGAHALVLGPDGKSIYIVHGNSTPLVGDVSPDSPYRNWGEDDLLPKLKDPVASFFDKLKSPYGYVLRTDENGTKWELYAGGFRNPYDIDFNTDGELFTYDSDMEWDRGLPWYRPTRVLHVIPGGEYGFREGSAKWPDWYPDSLPPVVDVGLGCPTGVKFGTNAKGWPEKYRKAFFICDWTFGRLLAVHMKEKGASYTAANPLKSYTYPKDAEAGGDVENFLSGKGLPLTDVEFGKDGAMYLTVGGRGTQAGLYRVTWTGASDERDSAVPQVRIKEIPPRGLRRSLDGTEGEKLREGKINALGSADPFISFAGRMAFENAPSFGRERRDNPTTWSLPAFAGAWYDGPEGQQRGKLNALLLATRTGAAEQVVVLEKLKGFPLANSSIENAALKLRILELSFARHGRPSGEWVKTGLEKLIAQYPAKGTEATKLNRELCQLLVWLSNPTLGSENTGATETKVLLGAAPNPGAEIRTDRKGEAFHAALGEQVIERTLALMDAAPSQEEQIYYALCLRWAHGWTPQQRQRYFRWFHEKAVRFTGGNSFAKFVDRIRADAVSRVPDAEKAALGAWLGPMASADPQKSRPAEVKPRAFVKAWTLAELEPALDALKNRKPDLARGKQVYTDAQCAQCHLFRDGGGNVGPDLTAVAQRFGRKDILEAMLDPNKAVSDQYAMITLTVRKGGGGEDQVSGLVQEETSATITLLTDPLSGRTANFYTNVINKREKANVSIMPPALLNTLTAEEVADLLAYLGAR